MQPDTLRCSVFCAADDAGYMRTVPETPVSVMSVINRRKIRSCSAAELFVREPYSRIDDIHIDAGACRAIDVLMVQLCIGLVNPVQVPENVVLGNLNWRLNHG